jgi:amino acid permease
MELEYYDPNNYDDDDDDNNGPTTDPLLVVVRSNNNNNVDDENDSSDNNSIDDATAAMDVVYRLYLDGPPVRTTIKNETFSSSNDEFVVPSYYHYGTIANVCSATLGAGVLSLPYAMYQAGIFLGTILLIMASISTVISIDILISAMEYYRFYTSSVSYEELTHVVLSSQRSSSNHRSTVARTLVEVSIFIFCGGCAVAYVIAIQDILKKMMITTEDDNDNDTSTTTHTMLLVYGCIMIPLCLFKQIQSLRYASILSMAAIGTLLFTATLHYLMGVGHTDTDETDIQNSTTILPLLLLLLLEEQYSNQTFHHHLRDYMAPHRGMFSIFAAAPVVIFAFSCQVNVCQIYHELSSSITTTSSSRIHSNPKLIMRQVTILAVTICATLYLSISIVGLADFGNQIQPNLLSCYHPTRHTSTNGNHQDPPPPPRRLEFMSIADLAMGLAIVLAFPLNIFPARTTILGWILRRRIERQPQSQQRHSSNPDHQDDHPNTNDGGDGSIETTTIGGELQTPLLTKNNNDDCNNNHNDATTTDEKNDPNPLTRDTERNRMTTSSTNPLLLSNGGDDLERRNHNEQVEEEDEAGGFLEDNLLPLGRMESNREEDDPMEVSMRLHVVTTLFLTGIVLALALIIPDISVVFGLLGGTAASVLGFCVPGAIGIQMTNDQYETTGRYCQFTKIASCALLIGGTIVGILTTIVTIYNTLFMPTTTTTTATTVPSFSTT